MKVQYKQLGIGAEKVLKIINLQFPTYAENRTPAFVVTDSPTISLTVSGSCITSPRMEPSGNDLLDEVCLCLSK